MDLVNSVTQNSNNRNDAMENSGSDDAGDGSSSSNNNNNNNNTTTTNNNNNNNCNNDDKNSHAGRNKQTNNQAANQQAGSGQEEMQHYHEATSAAAAGVIPAKRMPSDESKPVPDTTYKTPDYLKAIGMDPRKFWPRKYRFTREKAPGQYNPLTIAQRNFYESNGYIVIDDCMPAKVLEAIRQQHNKASFVEEFLIERLVARNSKLLQFVRCFCDERLMLMTHRMVDKFQPAELAQSIIDQGETHRQQLFRDWVYLPFRPIDKVVCVVGAIEPLEHTVLVVPGTHRVGQCNISSTLENISAAYDTSQERSHQLISREVYECTPEKLSSLVENSRKGFRYVNLKPGQTLFYHPGLIHGFSNDLINFNKRQLAVLAYYAAADCEYVDLRRSDELMSGKHQIPLSLAHFGDKNPCDYSSWLDRPRLLRDLKASL